MQNDSTKPNRARLAGWLAPAVLLPLTFASAQDPHKEFLSPNAEEDPRKQLEEAFQKVERGLEDMNVMLFEASKGDTSRLIKAKESGIDDLLRMAENRPQGDPTAALAELLYASSAEGSRVLEGIDEILEIAAKNGNPNSC